MKCILSLFSFLFFILTVDGKRRSFPKTANAEATNPPYEEHWFTAKLDNFAFTNTKTFKIRYLLNNTFYKDGGPIFFYTGNEGAIETFADAAGSMWDMAPLFNASLVFCEHRYYEKSLPFQDYDHTYDSVDHLMYQNTQQALADYAALLQYLKDNTTHAPVHYPKDTKVISFGGSYGGMLSTWFRYKYPHVVVGAWASSAPVAYFKGGKVDEGGFNKIATETMKKSGCHTSLFVRGWNVTHNMASNQAGIDLLNKMFKVDPKSLIKEANDAYALNTYIREAIEYMAMTDYPYSTGFLNSMPGWPAKVGCDRMNAVIGNSTTDEILMQGIDSFIEVYYNYGNSSDYTACFLDGCGDQATSGLGTPGGWDWQECTEIVIEMCARGGENDMFWDECSQYPNYLAEMKSGCKNEFSKINWTEGMMDETAIPRQYGLFFETATNLILTQGELDPWRAGGVPKGDPKRMLYVLSIQNAAHHLDLRQPNTCDPSNLAWIRYQIVNVFRCWLDSTQCSPDLNILDSPTSNIPNLDKCEDLVHAYPWGINVFSTTSNPLSTTTQTTSHSSLLSSLSLLGSIVIVFNY